MMCTGGDKILVRLNMQEPRWSILVRDLWIMIFQRSQLFYLKWTIPRVCKTWRDYSHSDNVWRRFWDVIHEEDQMVANHYWQNLSLRSKIRNLCFGWYPDSYDDQRLLKILEIITDQKYIRLLTRVVYHHYNGHVGERRLIRYQKGDEQVAVIYYQTPDMPQPEDPNVKRRIVGVTCKVRGRIQCVATNHYAYDVHIQSGDVTPFRVEWMGDPNVISGCCGWFASGCTWQMQIHHLIHCVYHDNIERGTQWYHWPKLTLLPLLGEDRTAYENSLWNQNIFARDRVHELLCIEVDPNYVSRKPPVYKKQKRGPFHVDVYHDLLAIVRSEEGPRCEWCDNEATTKAWVECGSFWLCDECHEQWKPRTF